MVKDKIHKLKVNFNSHCSDELFAEAFTLAEILITLVIIGVVAAITVPMLMNDTNDKQWNVARQKAQSTIGEAFRLATINGEISASDTNSNTAEKFVKNVLPKYLKISKSCGSGADCGFSSKVKRPDGTEMFWTDKLTDTTLAKVTDMTNQPTSKGSRGLLVDYSGDIAPYYFQTIDGFSVKVFYNANCAVDTKDRFRQFDELNNVYHYMQQSLDTACIFGTYDMNGSKGPNTVGKDIGFIGSFYNGYEAKAATVLPYKEDKKGLDIGSISGDYWLAAAKYCNELHENDWILPDLNELSLIQLNNMLVNGEKATEKWYWTRQMLPNARTYFYTVGFKDNVSAGNRYWATRLYSDDITYALCVRNNALK